MLQRLLQSLKAAKDKWQVANTVANHAVHGAAVSIGADGSRPFAVVPVESQVVQSVGLPQALASSAILDETPFTASATGASAAAVNRHHQQPQQLPQQLPQQFPQQLSQQTPHQVAPMPHITWPQPVVSWPGLLDQRGHTHAFKMHTVTW